MSAMGMDELALLAHELVRGFQRMNEGELAQHLDWVNYHRFMKARVRDESLLSALRGSSYSPRDVQAEVVRVSEDLTDQVHFHEEASAFIVVLGESEHVDEPVAAEMYDGVRWNPLGKCQIEIPARRAHGFRVDPEKRGILYFLSVQSPPIVRPDGEDDYHPLVVR